MRSLILSIFCFSTSVCAIGIHIGISYMGGTINIFSICGISVGFVFTLVGLILSLVRINKAMSIF